MQFESGAVSPIGRGQLSADISGVWEEIDFDKSLWTIPAERMKADAPHIVPLSPAVVEILQGLPRWTGDYVFSNTNEEQTLDQERK